MPIVAMPDGAQVSFPDEMSADEIKGLIVQKFPELGQQAPQEAGRPQGLLANAIEPITSYPSTQGQMARESAQQVGEGINRIGRAFTPKSGPRVGPFPDEQGANAVTGAGEVALGGLGYIASPINAALRTVVGKPVENITGIPKEVTEFGASFALPIPKKIPTGIGRTAEVAAPTTKELGEIASGQYKQFRANPAQFSPETTGALADHIVASMKEKGGYEHLTEGVHKTVNLLRKEEPTNLAEMKSYLEALQPDRFSPDKRIRSAANIATAEIKSFLGRTEPEAAATLNKADANFAAMSRSKEVEQAAEIAGLRTGRAGYGGNAVNNFRQVMSPFVERAIKENPHGFRPDEIAAVREVVEGTRATNIARDFGSLSPSKGGIQTGIAIGTAGMTAIPGMIGNKVAAIMTRNQVDRLSELLRKRSPAYEEAVSKAAGKYTTAADEFIADPTPGRFLKVVTASRALSSGFNRDGISISSGDLIRGIQGPMKSAAEDEQPSPDGVLNQ